MFVELTDTKGKKRLFNSDNIVCVHRNVVDGTATIELVGERLLPMVESYEMVVLKFQTTHDQPQCRLPVGSAQLPSRLVCLVGGLLVRRRGQAFFNGRRVEPCKRKTSRDPTSS
jgi:hypothetical protein